MKTRNAVSVSWFEKAAMASMAIAALAMAGKPMTALLATNSPPGYIGAGLICAVGLILTAQAGKLARALVRVAQPGHA